MERPSLLAMLPEDLATHLQTRGVTVRPTDARRVLAHVIADGQDDLGTKANLPRRVREAVDAHTRRDRPALEARVPSSEDGGVRYLFRFRDGRAAEAVRIPLARPGCFTVCLSSQVGCAMKCDFCATGRLGLTRNLDADEIVGTFLHVRDEVRADGGRVTGAVFMGQGEPLHNYDAVIRAARVLSDPCGGRIDARAITISTVGLVPQIRRYTAEGHRYRLIVSLTSAVPERRARLVPVAGRTPLPELMDAVRAHQAATGDRQTLAWVLLGGENDGPDEVDALRDLVTDLPIRLNLIDVNDARPDGYRRASDPERDAFLDALQVLRAPIVRRFSVGRDEHAACGMLAARLQAAD